MPAAAGGLAARQCPITSASGLPTRPCRIRASAARSASSTFFELAPRAGLIAPRVRYDIAASTRSPEFSTPCPSLSEIKPSIFDGGEHRPTLVSCRLAQRWCCPAEALSKATRRAAGKRAERFRAASSRRVIRVVHATTGASVRLTCVAKRIPYSPRPQAQREYERRPFSRLAIVGLGRAAPSLGYSGSAVHRMFTY